MTASGKNLFAILTLLFLLLPAFPASGLAQDLGGNPAPVSLEVDPTQDKIDPKGINSTNTKVQGVPSDQDIATCHQDLVQNAGSVAREKIAFGDALFNALDTRLNTCWDQINQLFAFAGTTSDPLNLVYSAVESMIIQKVTDIANQLCSAALSVVDQLKNYALSQFNRLCIPLPNFGAGLNVNLGLQGPPCNGTQLLPLSQMFSTTRPPAYDRSQVLPKSSSSSTGQ